MQKVRSFMAVGGANTKSKDTIPTTKAMGRKQIDAVTDKNNLMRSGEAKAKLDSIVGASKAKSMGKDLVDQRRAGNAAANKSRKESGVPKVERMRVNVNASQDADKYAPYFRPTADSYIRVSSVEKDPTRASVKAYGKKK